MGLREPWVVGRTGWVLSAAHRLGHESAHREVSVTVRDRSMGVHTSGGTGGCVRARLGAWAGGEGACGVCAAVCVRVCVCGGGGGDGLYELGQPVGEGGPVDEGGPDGALGVSVWL